MEEKTKNQISYIYRIMFAISVIILMVFSEKLKDSGVFIICSMFILGGIVGLVTNRNARQDPTMASREGSITWKVINTFEILTGIFVMLVYIWSKTK